MNFGLPANCCRLRISVHLSQECLEQYPVTHLAMMQSATCAAHFEIQRIPSSRSHLIYDSAKTHIDQTISSNRARPCVVQPQHSRMLLKRESFSDATSGGSQGCAVNQDGVAKCIESGGMQGSFGPLNLGCLMFKRTPTFLQGIEHR